MAGRNASPASTSSTASNVTVRTDHHLAARSSISASPPTSTPPTSHGDEASVLSDATKLDTVVELHGDVSTPRAQPEAQTTPGSAAEAAKSEGRRSARSTRAAVSTYNVQILAGTAIHTPTKYLPKHHENVLHGPLPKSAVHSLMATPAGKGIKAEADDSCDPAEEQLATEAAEAAQRRRSSRVTDLRKDAFRNLAAAGDAMAQKGQELLAAGKQKVQHALRNTMSESQSAASQHALTKSSPRKRARASTLPTPEDERSEAEPQKEFLKPKTKQWLTQGLYVGQYREFNPRFKESQNRLRRKSKPIKEKERDEVIPLPMFSGEQLLEADPTAHWRDFKLPFDTYHPLPRKIKVDGWVQLRKNRFIGESSALWKRDKQDSSQCYCSPEDGCGEACHNRIMSYECDSTNCPLTADECTNRPFAQLKKRAKGNRYDYGVEVMETGERGYGVRAMRMFDPHQIIVEYAGEIITQDECERRMKHVYKKDKCYYLMSFDNKMIIDATRGTIARFVNHSCEPNCEMIKWTVGGEPRMALFAGSRGIMTGEELTYDYNFDPFSSKNIQICKCGTESCRGVLGPKPKDWNRPKMTMTSSIVAGAKRKIQEVLGSSRGSSSVQNSPKKRKLSAIASSALTKAKNSITESASSQDKAKQTATELEAQKASRENRALRRSTSMTLTSRRSKVVHKASRRSLPVLKSSRHTTVTIKHKTPRSVPRPGALKPINKSSRLPSILQRNIPVSKARKSSSSLKAPKTPARSARSAKSPSPDSSPNITPASLRSANRPSAKKLKQSKLPFKALNLGSSKSSKSTKSTADSEPMVENTDSEDDDIEEEFNAKPSRTPKRPVTANSMRRATASAKKTFERSVRTSTRAVGVGKAGLRGDLNEGVRGNTIRMLTEDDD
ncbi:hypothetical protein BCR34DRAFT_595283 [Clohesyomyces aquaticus]|uniref:SET domain-containing protein n=1 Tax=Clohesyomyces aquaticus TaxID=1231657 RepID=A0A1Y2AC24_9PLEO|nr:hypothetical protein BCR34DRAFT_595283 [Clohesyomyces aquaticus]